MANKKLDALVFSSTKNKNEIVQATITTLNSKENKNPGNKYLAQVSHIHIDGENAGKQYFVVSDGLKTEKSLNSNLLDINVGLSAEQVQALIAQAQLNGANIDQEVLKNLIAQELAKNPTTGITEQRVQELITQSTITEQRVQELITQNSITIDDATANATKVFSSQKVEELLTPKLEENQVKTLITEELAKHPSSPTIDESRIQQLIVTEIANSDTILSVEEIKTLITTEVSKAIGKNPVGGGQTQIPIDETTSIQIDNVFKGPMLPVLAREGEYYKNTTKNKLYMVINKKWVLINLESISEEGASDPEDSFPESPLIGNIYKNTTTNKLFLFTTQKWVLIDNIQPTYSSDLEIEESGYVTQILTGNLYCLNSWDRYYIYMSNEWKPLFLAAYTKSGATPPSEVGALGDIYRDIKKNEYYIYCNLNSETRGWQKVEEGKYSNCNAKQIFTTSGTFVAPSSCKAIVHIIGPGGCGECNLNNISNSNHYGKGGDGGYSIDEINLIKGTSYNYIVAAPSNTTASISKFNETLTAGGGGGTRSLNSACGGAGYKSQSGYYIDTLNQSKNTSSNWYGGDQYVPGINTNIQYSDGGILLSDKTGSGGAGGNYTKSGSTYHYSGGGGGGWGSFRGGNGGDAGAYFTGSNNLVGTAGGGGAGGIFGGNGGNASTDNKYKNIAKAGAGGSGGKVKGLAGKGCIPNIDGSGLDLSDEAAQYYKKLAEKYSVRKVFGSDNYGKGTNIQASANPESARSAIAVYYYDPDLEVPAFS